MSLNRYAAKRDANEPEVRKRFASHGWHTEQVSSAGGWDLDCYPRIRVTTLLRTGKVVVHVDVKDGGGKITTAQVKKWTALRALGIPVYVVRTEADVDALVHGTLAPWEPSSRPPQTIPAIRTEEWTGKTKRTPKDSYTPPRSKPVDAAKEAEAFAPPMCSVPGCNGMVPCPRHLMDAQRRRLP